MRLFKGKQYKFTDKKLSVRGAVSTVFFVVALALTIFAIYISYKYKGHGSITVGALGTTAFLVSVGGFAMGLYSFKEEDVFLKLPWAGTVGNALLGLFLAGVILIGI